MKTVGLLGGMSWESTQTYYQLINQGIKHQLGGLHSGKIILYSVDFAEIEALQHNDGWLQAAERLSDAAMGVQAAGADFLMICTNTMHKVFDQVQENIDIPMLHIADATGEQLQAMGITKVGLLGTAFTMEQDFYKSRLTNKFAIDVVIPNKNQRDLVHNVIYQELCQGIINHDSKQQHLRIIEDLAKHGAQAVILGCTEIGLLIQQDDCNIPLIDTTDVHANAAITAMLTP
ncbi:aspartate/glutamate racemase family protein [Thalassotalea sp. Y01]|uniref:aspartate/glutamate racemase family protein n=1 Tax=Thalassotalea sp. Y01 TaxID=2729613 RepID=UPI00145F018A|nr:aspartate/glutamate racemase family protein [Thalassotalea sp. Y01]NMP17376.1 aspartate/glutamate racemase family protein [Thalassotalea sp. Y01]